VLLGILRVISGWIFNVPKSLIEIDVSCTVSYFRWSK